jgi:hypothetical protein
LDDGEAVSNMVIPLTAGRLKSSRSRGTTAKRAALWCFREIETLRRNLIQRAGRIIRPAGKVILSMNSNEKLENELLHSLGLLKALGE